VNDAAPILGSTLAFVLVDRLPLARSVLEKS
jgi:hypothetical protein